MTKIPFRDLRTATPSDGVSPAPALQGVGFNLEPRATLIYEPTGVPHYDYNILVGANEIAGRIEIVMEPDAGKLADTGQICGVVFERYREGDLLARVVKALLRLAADRGFPQVMIVVPSSDDYFTGTCRAAGLAELDEIDRPDGRHTRFVVDLQP